MIFTIPYDSGHKGLRMGAGPSRLRDLFPDVAAEEINPRREFLAEIATSFELYSLLAERISQVRGFPVVLSGNCGACVGTAAGVGVDDLAVIWFDAHGDYMTPDTSTSGFLDGMGMSILTGRCFKKLAAKIPGFSPVPASRTVHAGGRDWSEGELDALHASGIAVIAPGEDASAALDRVAAGRMLVHIDLDVIGSEYGIANEYSAPGGLSPDELLRMLEQVRERFNVVALDLASYDPSCDRDGRILDCARRVAAMFPGT